MKSSIIIALIILLGIVIGTLHIPLTKQVLIVVIIGVLVATAVTKPSSK